MSLTLNAIRFPVLGAVMGLTYAAILFRLWEVQIKDGEEHRENISKQSIRSIRDPGVRGRIYSSDGKLLADNRPSYNVVFHLSEMRKPGRQAKTIKHILECAERIANVLKKPQPLTEKIVRHHINTKPGMTLSLFKNLTQKELAIVSELMPPVAGMEIKTEPVRLYPEGKKCAHVIGYVGREDPVKAEDKEDFFYYVPDPVGRNGAENTFDNELRGEPGTSLVRVNNVGYIHEVIESSPARMGADVVLTIDWKAQEIAERLMDGKTGAFIVLDADNGEVLAMLSAPAYNPQDFVPHIFSKKWKELNSNPLRPMINRALSGTYMPGSIIKPLIALALQKNGISPKETVTCDGATTIGNAVIRCWSWRSGGHGTVNMTEAIRSSCNDYFIEKGSQIGLDNIVVVLESAGIGSPSGIQLPEEKGMLPSREVKQKLYKMPWNQYDTGILSIGQGIILLTPIQAASYVAAIANGGKVMKPSILGKIIPQDGKAALRYSPELKSRLKASQESLKIVKEGMYKAVNDPEGSSKLAKNDKIVLYGKTGTAEVGPRSNRYTNTWFIAFGSDKGKTYAICIFIEKGMSGGRTCAPLAAEFFDEYLQKDDSE
ncbi:MAG: penicillin-binding protein 2 [Lentisphaerae bacterium GWF2_45_14]|nr:MAG: penicillin-binding protein 2 [Lentisphaerae bacterium GWF2_45_14]